MTATFRIGKTNKPSDKKGTRARPFITMAYALAARKKAALGKKEPHVKYVGFQIKFVESPTGGDGPSR